MKTLVVFVSVLLSSLVLPVKAGVSWKAIWLEPFEIVMETGQARPYTIKGIRLGDVEVDITKAPLVEIGSEDPGVIAVDPEAHTLTAKKTGRTRVRIRFDHITVYDDAWVNAPGKK